eukprot:CAMPEP_0168732520 /NCGR_PEP_ID=MMETSP0724-20121128/7813_1 /TAXON_ID=265536 /ORGANISM="Amphiprora sp., Strain CCMP467" /LENGTH=142 /DNA_ID=CAMNT_0008779541 /DNA_START=93 /DNA_END=521 /DNA_ORIENTATION=+
MIHTDRSTASTDFDSELGISEEEERIIQRLNKHDRVRRNAEPMEKSVTPPPPPPPPPPPSTKLRSSLTMMPRSRGLAPIIEVDSPSDRKHCRWGDSVSPSSGLRKSKSFDASSLMTSTLKEDAPPRPKRRLSSPYAKLRKSL